MLFKFLNKTVLSIIYIACLCFSTNAMSAKILTLPDLKNIIHALPSNDIPVVANDAVLRELNLIIETPGLNRTYQEAIERVAKQQQLKTILESKKVPTDLMAIVLVESRGKNIISRNPNGITNGGLWQEIPSMARHYGLVVNAHNDERLNPTKSTEAAAHYLLDLKGTLGSWPLAIMGYNLGGDKVEYLIRKNHSTDPWVLLSTLKNKKTQRYLPTIEAAVILMRHPELLRS